MIRDERDHRLSLAALAARLDRHPVHVARAFRRHFGMSIGAYRRGMRVQRATTLLRGGRLDLTPIALSCGFASHAHFCRSFRAALGVTPSQFRRSSRGSRVAQDLAADSLD